jgi:hypothetical protein
MAVGGELVVDEKLVVRSDALLELRSGLCSMARFDGL